jgi:hypothetical protein
MLRQENYRTMLIFWERLLPAVEPAIDLQRRAGDENGILAGQIGDGAADSMRQVSSTGFAPRV